MTMMSGTVVSWFGNEILKINSVVLDVKKTAGVASEVNLTKGDLPNLETQSSTSPEV